MMEEIIQLLRNDVTLTLVVKSADGSLHRFNQRGVKDLLALVTTMPEVLHGALIADKAVGKAAAACMVQGGVAQVYANVMSEPAMAMLHKHGVKADCDQLVDHIINRNGTDWCPMEKLSRDVDDPSAIILRIQNFFATH